MSVDMSGRAFGRGAKRHEVSSHPACAHLRYGSLAIKRAYAIIEGGLPGIIPQPHFSDMATRRTVPSKPISSISP